MHPEIWFCDCTSETNRQNRDFFLMAVRNPTGLTFPGNVTVIPSGQRWVFACLSKIAFRFIYGKETCERNRISIHDEDWSQYNAFEDAIKSVPYFKRSKLTLCVFHGVWQPFAETVLPHLPRKSKKSKILSEAGKEWGNLIYGFFIKQVSRTHCIENSL